MLVPLPEGGLWWPAERLLVVSDLHLEKGSAYAAKGQMLPPYDTGATLGVVERLCEALMPATVISLGDSFHDRAAELRLPETYADRIRALTATHDWVWVEGNHDPDPPAHLGGRAERTVRIGSLVFRHEPEGEQGEVAGHVGEENGDVEQVFPTRAAGFKHGADIGEHRFGLRADVVFDHLPAGVADVAGNGVGSRFARADAGQEQQVAGAACVRIGANRRWCTIRLDAAHLLPPACTASSACR